MRTEGSRQRGTETAMVTVNGVQLAYEVYGSGETPLVMVHGGWISRRYWNPVVPRLAQSFRVLSYDRRGHGESEKPGGQGSIHEDVADLAALIEHLGLSPAWVAGQSSGANIVLRLAAERPDLLQGVIAHEPGLMLLLADDPATAPLLEDVGQLTSEVMERIASGDYVGAAEQFVKEGLGPGVWSKFPPELRQDMVENTLTVVDDLNDPDESAFDLEWVREFPHPVLLTKGDRSTPAFEPIVTKLAEAMPMAEVSEFKGAGHVPHVEKPREYVATVTAFIEKHRDTPARDFGSLTHS